MFVTSIGGTESDFAGGTAASAPATYEAEQRQTSVAELRIRRRVLYRVRNRAAVEESGIRPVGHSLGPERIWVQTVQLGAAKKGIWKGDSVGTWDQRFDSPFLQR